MSVQLQGFDELVQELTNAPKDMRDDGMVIVSEETEGAAIEIANEYAKRVKGRGTGNLVKRVKTSYPAEAVLIGIVQSRSPDSPLFEFGTKERKTANGANRGRMPKQEPGVTPVIATKRRARMVRRLIEMVRGYGFEISGQ